MATIRWLAVCFFVGVAWLLGANVARAADWQRAAGPLMTRWAKDVSPEKVHAEYPRPQMVRPDWTNLNGLWEYAVRPKADAVPEKFDGQILVPFPIESALSGVMKRVDPASRVWYRRTIALSKDRDGLRVLLHFGAVNWETTVWLNGKELGQHRGGYDGFTFDITDSLAPGATQQLVVAVWNPIDSGTQPRGKQVGRPGGIMYTPSTGIWQTVWLEVVPAVRIDSLQVVPDVDAKTVRVMVTVVGATAEDGKIVSVTVTDGSHEVARVDGAVEKPIELRIAEPKLWSPDHPFLYGLKVRMNDPLANIVALPDEVESYFAMRKISVAKDTQGVTRIFLNNHPQFMMGPLDQGFWPDGLYTAPTDEALRYDIETTKKLGFNMARKHVKVEPDRWYYWCDKLGLLVWQDMPSGDRGIGGGQPDIVRSAESAKQFEQELKAMIDGRRNHPSIVMWVVFNEGWGQFDTARQTDWVKQYDPSRLVDCASGWQDRGVGNVVDMHSYPGPASPKPEEHRAAVLGEFGGLGLPVEGHTWQPKKGWGYRTFKDAAGLTDAYVDLIQGLRPLRSKPGLSAAVYTQTTDVETEVNGLMTYDRAMIKPDLERASAANRSAFLPLGN
jgi:beta-galactosidase/beta-glucuronidase